MGKETLEELKAIRDSAPENFNYIDDDGFYWLVTGGNTNNYIFADGESLETTTSPHPLGLRSLQEIEDKISLVEELRVLSRDARRLNYLDSCNAEFNEKMGSNYGWKVDWNFNRIALVDTGFAGVSVRQAIDGFIERRGDS